MILNSTAQTHGTKIFIFSVNKNRLQIVTQDIVEKEPFIKPKDDKIRFYSFSNYIKIFFYSFEKSAINKYIY